MPTTDRSSRTTPRRASLGFEKELWEAADLLRNNMDPSEYNGSFGVGGVEMTVFSAVKLGR